MNPRTKESLAPLWRSWSIWGIAALFYLTAFYQRVSPAVMTSELMRDFHIGAKDLGNLSAFYFYFYVAMQIPTGILIDSWGARRLLISGSMTAAVGTYLVAATSNFALACAGRALVGASTALGFLVLLRLSIHWFPARRFAMLTGLGLCFGNFGALVAQVPLRLLIEDFGWRVVVIGSAVVILGVGILAWLMVQNDPTDYGFRSFAPPDTRKAGQSSSVIVGLRRIFAYRNPWLIFIAQGGFVGPMLAFTGLWGTPFLHARFGLPTKQAAGICSIMTVCWALASPVFGHFSDHIGRRKPLYIAGATVAAAGWLIMVYVPLPLPVFIAAASITSMASGAVIIGFALAKESVPIEFSGTIAGVINMGNMIGPMILQPAIGWMLDRHWSGQLSNGLRVYGSSGFQAAFVLVVAWSLVTFCALSFTRETRCKQAA